MQRARDELANALLAAEERAAEAETAATAAVVPPTPRTATQLRKRAGRTDADLQVDAEILLDELDKQRNANAG